MAEEPPPADLDPLELEVRELRQLVRKQAKELEAVTKRVTELERRRRSDAMAIVGRR